MVLRKGRQGWALGLSALAVVLGLAWAAVADDMGMQPAKMPAEFDKVKGLVGTWKGTTEMEGKPMDVTNTFELTSGGTAVMERLFVGTPKEMVSMYCAKGGKLVMTHYCTIGNQPQMSLMKATDGEMDFSMKGTAGIGSATDAHMHSMNIVWKDADHITEQWTMYGGGKQQKAVEFVLARVPAQ
jgi:hypothetical protein